MTITDPNGNMDPKVKRISRFGMEVIADPKKGTIDIKEFPRGFHPANQQVISLQADPDPGYVDREGFGNYAQDRTEPSGGTLGSASYRYLLALVMAVYHNPDATLTPALGAALTAEGQSTTKVYPTGATGLLVRVGVGSDFSDWYANTPDVRAAGITVPAAGQPIADGDTLKVQVTNQDVSGTVTVSDEFTWDVPQGAVTIDNADDYSSISYSVSGTFDSGTTERNFKVEVLDENGDVLGSFLIEGTAAAPTEPALDLTSAPYSIPDQSADFSLRVTAYDEIGYEITPAVDSNILA